MRSEPLAGGATELLERYARLSLERDDLAARVAELERELAVRRPVDIPGRSRRRDALVWIGVVLASALTLAVVLGGAALIAGFWDPLEDDRAIPALTSSAPSPSASRQSGSRPLPESSRPASPPASSLVSEPPTSTGALTKVELDILAAQGDSWLQVRRRSASGPVVYEGILRRGGSKRFSARRIWFRFGVGDHLEVKVNGKPASNLPSLAGDAAATPAGVRVLSVG